MYLLNIGTHEHLMHVSTYDMDLFLIRSYF